MSLFTRLSDLELVSVLDSFDVLSLVALSQTCKRLYLAAHDVMSRSPSMVQDVVQLTPGSLRNLASHLQSPPTIAIIWSAFGTNGFAQARPAFKDMLRRELPSAIAMVMADNAYVQNNSTYESKRKKESKTLPLKAVVMLGAFPEAKSHSALITKQMVVKHLKLEEHKDEGKEEDEIVSIDTLMQSEGFDPAVDWRFFMVSVHEYDDWSTTFVKRLQARYPKASIIGGICTTGLACASSSEKGFTTTLDGEFQGSLSLLGMAGNCPVQTIVSRGVEPVSDTYNITDASWSEEDNNAMPAGEVMRVAQCQHAARANSSGTCPEEGVYDVLVAASRRAHSSFGLLMGLRIPVPTATLAIAGAAASEGFVLVQVTREHIIPSEDGVHKLSLILEDGGDVLPTQIRFFTITAKSCARDVVTQMNTAKASFKQRNERVMGAIMFSCSARGPNKSEMLPTEMYDSSCFKKTFGDDVPLIGRYENGEIGPQAMASDEGSHIFRSGNVAVQGFTAVFGIFALPSNKAESQLKALLSATPALGLSAEQLVGRIVSDVLLKKRSQHSRP